MVYSWDMDLAPYPVLDLVLATVMEDMELITTTTVIGGLMIAQGRKLINY